MRSRRFASRVRRDLHREQLVSPFPELGLVASGGPNDPEPELVVENGVVVRMDGRAAAADIARAQMLAGTVDITTVLQAETALFNDQDILAQVRLTRFQALLNIYKALGGGWVAPSGPILEQFPGLEPGMLPGGIALPVGGNVR